MSTGAYIKVTRRPVSIAGEVSVTVAVESIRAVYDDETITGSFGVIQFKGIPSEGDLYCIENCDAITTAMSNALGEIKDEDVISVGLMPVKSL